MERFTAQSGIDLQSMKNGVQNPVFLGFMFDYALSDETMIREFAESHNLSPQALVAARRALPGANDDF